MSVAIVASVMAPDAVALTAAAAAAVGFADRLEVRADGWTASFAALLDTIARLPKPVIVTLRPRSEGGRFDGSEGERRELLRRAARVARWIDVEARAPFANESFAPAKKIVSWHDFDATPARLEELAATLAECHRDAEAIKLAVTPRSLTEVARIARAQQEAARAGLRCAWMGIGELALPLRALAGKLGAPLVYGSVPGHAATASGQPSVADLATLYRVREQQPATPVCAVVGRPIAHSLGPRLHNTLYRQRSIDRVFIPLLGDEPSLDSGVGDTLAAALSCCDGLGIDGVSVTLPFKEAAARLAVGPIDGEPWPPPAGSVNTLRRNASGWQAANTDRIGFLAALERAAPGLLASRPRALVLGAGGAARTVVAVLTDHGARVVIASRTDARAAALATELHAEWVPWPDRVHIERDLIVNATPLGMSPNVTTTPMPDDALRSTDRVFDLVYRPRRTRLLYDAVVTGAHAIGGVEMFVQQALAQHQLFTGDTADAELARAIVIEALDGDDRRMPTTAADTYRLTPPVT